MHECICIVKMYEYYPNIVIKANKILTVSISSKHTHEPNFNVKIERQVLRENVIKKANDFFSFNKFDIINTISYAVV